MKQATQVFRSRNVDTTGHPLRVDGRIGSLTWTALFGPDSCPSSLAPASPLLVEVLVKAAGL